MVQLRNEAIGEEVLKEFLETQSDFAFEIEVLNLLLKSDFQCEHSGTYDDPVTKIPRQFDIRALKGGRVGNKRLRLAVECKNIRNNFPLLVSCVPRRSDEAYHQVVYSIRERTTILDRSGARNCSRSPIYERDDPVGKSCNQVGKRLNDEIIGSDSDIYGKWSQALSSAADLITHAMCEGEQSEESLTLVVPIVVVPNERLWWVCYDSQGELVEGPKSVPNCSYYVKRQYEVTLQTRVERVEISHLEFVTISGLRQRVENLWDQLGLHPIERCRQ